jgi:hypothetical protein
MKGQIQKKKFDMRLKLTLVMLSAVIVITAFESFSHHQKNNRAFGGQFSP